MEPFLNIGLPHILTLAALVFVIGVVGVFLNRKNLLVLLMCLELMLLAVNINLIAFAAHHGDIGGQVFVFFILTVAAAEVAIGLAIITLFFRTHGRIDVDAADMMRG